MRIKSSPLPHWSERPKGVTIDTLIIHSLFALTSSDPFDVESCLQALATNKVATHYLIARNGQTLKLVDEENKAWHAGASKIPFANDQRENVNDFSLGVELIATETSGFTKRQYSALTALTLDILRRHPLKYILGHEHIAPGRKQDPGPLFDWKIYRQGLLETASTTTGLIFPISET